MPFSSSHLGQNLTAVFQSCFAPSGDLFRPATSQRSHRQGFPAAARGEIEGELGTLAALGEYLQTDAGRSVCGSHLGSRPWFQAEATSSYPGSRVGRRSRAAGAGLALPKGCAVCLSAPRQRLVTDPARWCGLSPRGARGSCHLEVPAIHP